MALEILLQSLCFCLKTICPFFKELCSSNSDVCSSQILHIQAEEQKSLIQANLVSRETPSEVGSSQNRQAYRITLEQRQEK